MMGHEPMRKTKIKIAAVMTSIIIMATMVMSVLIGAIGADAVKTLVNIHIIC